MVVLWVCPVDGLADAASAVTPALALALVAVVATAVAVVVIVAVLARALVVAAVAAAAEAKPRLSVEAKPRMSVLWLFSILALFMLTLSLSSFVWFCRRGVTGVAFVVGGIVGLN